jgi:hypothetical protein
MPAIAAFVLPSCNNEIKWLGVHIVPSRIHRVGELIRPCNFEFESPLGDLRAGQFKCPKGRIRKVRWVNIWKDFNMALVYVLLSVAIFSQWIDSGYFPCTIVPHSFDIPKYSRKFIRRLPFRTSV